jgi:hypothetical protein
VNPLFDSCSPDNPKRADPAPDQAILMRSAGKQPNKDFTRKASRHQTAWQRVEHEFSALRSMIAIKRLNYPSPTHPPPLSLSKEKGSIGCIDEA